MAHFLEHWSNRLINWELLRGFGESSVASVTIVTPFIGYFVLYHAELSHVLGGMGGLLEEVAASAHACPSYLNFADRLSFLYFGLISLGLGAIIYRLFVPEIVKRYGGISAYVSEEIDRVSARNLRTQFVTISSRRPTLVDDLVSRAPWLNRNNVTLKTASDAFAERRDDQIAIDVLRSYYNIMNRHKARAAVYVAAGLYFLGFSLLGIPSILFSLRVACTIAYR